MDWDDIINTVNGTVDFSNIESCSFEFIEELYEGIAPLLRQRQRKEVPEASSNPHLFKKSGNE